MRLTLLLLACAVSGCDGEVKTAEPAAKHEAATDRTEITKATIPDLTIAFRRHQDAARVLSLRELSTHAPATVVESDDPYYGTRKKFRALPLNDVMRFAFDDDLATLRTNAFVLRALDGYAVPVQGARLLEGGAYLAFDDVDVPGFAPIGPQQVSPAPTYLVWTQPGQNNLDTHPRPWQLSSIEIVSLAELYPHTVPTGEASDSAAQHGYAVFVDHCIKCHAINREGGRVGPELNVPQSIVEYRPLPQIRAYIRNPQAFRYGAMPAHPQLTDADLDGLLAYFSAMAQRKHDPDASAASAASDAPSAPDDKAAAP